MNLIINDNNFSINNIKLKNSKKSTKILYNFKNIDIIGLSFTISYFDCNCNNNFSYITLKDKKQLSNFIEIDNFLKRNITNYETFIRNNMIKVKGNFKNKDNIDINVNSLKFINSSNKVQIFII